MLEVHLDGEGQAREALKDSECERTPDDKSQNENATVQVTLTYSLQPC